MCIRDRSEEDADYAVKIMNQVRLWSKALRINKASADKQKTLDIGAELFIGNLDPMVDERVLFDTFSRFGSLTNAPKVSRDENNLSRGFGFVSFTNFESADETIRVMSGQYLMNKEITVQYAYKKDGKGERHGDAAERELAASGKLRNIEPTSQPLPPQLFNASAPSAPSGMTNGTSAGYNSVPPPQQQQRQQLQPPPGGAGLPPRPPPSAAGYGGPPSNFGAGYGGPPPGAPPPGFGAPPGFGGPPPGMPNGYGVPPPGMAPPGYQRR